MTSKKDRNMKRTLATLLISIPALLISTHASAIGCVALSVDIQAAVRDENSPPPIQSSTATHAQGENCFRNKAIVVNKHIAIAPSVPLQASHTTIIQDTPAGQNPLQGTSIPSNTGNISKHIAIQIDIPVPYNKTKEKLDQLKKLKR